MHRQSSLSHVQAVSLPAGDLLFVSLRGPWHTLPGQLPRLAVPCSFGRQSAALSLLRSPPPSPPRPASSDWCLIFALLDILGPGNVGAGCVWGELVRPQEEAETGWGGRAYRSHRPGASRTGRVRAKLRLDPRGVPGDRQGRAGSQRRPGCLDSFRGAQPRGD